MFLTKSGRLILIFYLISLVITIDMGLPIQVNPDEITQLLNVYGSISSGTIRRVYDTAYSGWVQIFYGPIVLLYWLFVYIVQGLPELSVFKVYVIDHYQDALYLLRGFVAFFFIVSLYFFSKTVVAQFYDKRAALYFFTFVLLDLLVYVNLHYSKHWVLSISLLMWSFVVYFKFLTRKRVIYLVSAASLFSISVLLTVPVSVFSIGFILMLFSYGKPRMGEIVQHVLIFSLVFFLYLVLTLYIGADRRIEELIYGGSLKDPVHTDVLFDISYVLSFFDYNPVLFMLSLIALLVALVIAQKKKLFLLIPAVVYLAILSVFHHFEPRYLIPVIISFSLFVAVVFSSQNWFKYPVLVLLFFNSIVLSTWTYIVSNVDTRNQAREWIIEHSNEPVFVLYNTFSFPYAPLSIAPLISLEKEFPGLLGHREHLRIRYTIPGGINGLTLRRIDESTYSPAKVVNSLLDRGYKVYLINERFGKGAIFSQPAQVAYREMHDSFIMKRVREYLPFQEKPDDFDKFGDIVYNFNYVVESLLLFDHPGPNLDIFEVTKVIE
jgi:hypothetical protein